MCCALRVLRLTSCCVNVGFLQRWVWRILAPLALHKRVKKSRGRKRKGGKHQRGRAKRARRGEGEDAVFGTPEGAPETAGSAEGEPADPGVDAGEHTWGSDAATGSERQLVALGPSAPGTSISKAGRGGRVGGEVRRGIQELVRGTMAWRLRGLSAYLGIVGEAAHCPLLACSPRPPPVPFFYRTALGEPLLGQVSAAFSRARAHCLCCWYKHGLEVTLVHLVKVMPCAFGP